MKIICENNQGVKGIKYFCKIISAEMFYGVINTPLILKLLNNKFVSCQNKLSAKTLFQGNL